MPYRNYDLSSRNFNHGGRRGGGGGTLIFLYIRRLCLFLGFKILNFDIFLGFQKNKYILGYEILWIFFWGHHKIGLYLEVISMHFKVFS